MAGFIVPQTKEREKNRKIIQKQNIKKVRWNVSLRNLRTLAISNVFKNSKKKIK